MQFKFITVLFLFCSALLSSQNQNENNKIKVACIGNSITYGAFIKNRLKDAYPFQLNQLLGESYEVRNFGVSGSTLLTKGDAPYIHGNQYKEALEWQPNIVIIKLGTNDTKPQNWKYKSNFEKNYIELIDKFKGLNSEPKIYLCKAVPAFLIGSTISDTIISNELNPLIAQIAAIKKISLIDLYSPFENQPELFPDKIHPNAKGAGKMAKIIYTHISEKYKDFVAQEFPGKKSAWKGFERYDFDFSGKNARVIVPQKTLPGKPWVWRARFPNWHPEMDSILVSKGFHVAHLDTGLMYGSPKAMDLWDQFYEYLTTVHNFNEKLSLEGASRGGLFIYNWAKRHPSKVNCIYAEAPVLDFKSWPGGYGSGIGSKPDWKELKKSYGFSNDEDAKAYKKNPIDGLEQLAKAKIPILHMISLDDTVVPASENTMVFLNKYLQLGGPATIVPCTLGEHELNGHWFQIETPELGAQFIMNNTKLPKKKLDPTTFHHQRGGIKNSRIKFERTKKGRVAFLGGSITYNNGWRDSIVVYLKKRFPSTEFEFISAGIPSMGTTPGAFRLNRDVLSKGKVDLLFEEAAVNDATNGRSDSEQIRAMEGIVRQAQNENPEIDIVLMHFVDPDKISSYKSGIIPSVIQNHEKVADYYNISSINLAKEVTYRIEAGEFTWEDDFINLHPSPFGQGIYASSIKAFLDKSWFGFVAEDDKIKAAKSVVPLNDFNYGNAKFLSIDKANLTKEWEIVSNWKPTDGAGTRKGYTKTKMLITEEPGKPLELNFEGNLIGITVAAGPDAGIIEFSIDGSDYKKLDLYTPWSGGLHLPWYYVLDATLNNGKHILKLKMSDYSNNQSNGYACRIKSFLVNI